MPARRLEEIFDGQRRPVCAAPPLLSSAATPWAGFLMERDLCREGHAQTLFHPHTELVFVTSGSIEVEDHALRADKRFVAHASSVTLWPAGHEAKSIRWGPHESAAAAAEMIRIQLDLTLLHRLAPDDDRALDRKIVQQPGVDDAALAALVRLVETEVVTGCPSGRLFGESLCLTLATHITARYACMPATTPGRIGALSVRRFERVRDYIGTHLGDDLSLGELAQVAGLSPQHFATAFRKRADMTPHRYVLDQRIGEAKRLLAASNARSVADVAASLGFASQSHFTEVFRRRVGATPARYRQEH